MSAPKLTNVERAEAAWRGAVPDWVRLLAEQCDASNQKQVAARVGYSPAVINQVIGNRYTAGIGAFEQAVKGAFMHAVVECPVAGELAAHTCLEYQRRPFSATNPQRVALYRACRICPNNRRNTSDST